MLWYYNVDSFLVKIQSFQGTLFNMVHPVVLYQYIITQVRQ